MFPSSSTVPEAASPAAQWLPLPDAFARVGLRDSRRGVEDELVPVVLRTAEVVVHPLHRDLPLGVGLVADRAVVRASRLDAGHAELGAADADHLRFGAG